ncbi:hypothetical protein SAMN04488107_1320 [Geodermatophilus saharensis]|uniref:Uncharacterized protein n=1 Tax=Geodermatophilus saharensis TaxID=1137994 RepID=A0A239BQG1_9ACTN|nr:hypothetical protein SAMN04488107_1320 [Geodermatophilus saharensis]
MRVVDEPPLPADTVLDLAAVPRTPVLGWAGGGPRHVAGPPVEPAVMVEPARQVPAAQAGTRRWALVAARVGPARDVVAEGSAMRVHAVTDGALVRTVEALAFGHATDGAVTLADAAAAYERLARAAEAMAAAGGRLTESDDGLLVVRYDR